MLFRPVPANARLTAITEPAQRHYHNLVGLVFGVAREWSKRDDPNFNGENYDKKSRFVANLDESCAMATAGSGKVVGLKGRAHFTGSKDGRMTLTSMHVGTPHQVGGAGSAYLVAGKKGALSASYDTTPHSATKRFCVGTGPLPTRGCL